MNHKGFDNIDFAVERDLFGDNYLYRGAFLFSFTDYDSIDVGVRHGKGTLLENGNVYEGDWFRNKKQGVGKLTEARAKLVYNGQWYNDMRQGKGVECLRDGSKYKGGWSYNMRHGFGIQKEADGSVYEGPWFHNSKFNGGLSANML